MIAPGIQSHELEYVAYQNRQYGEIARAGLERRAAHLAPGGRAAFGDGLWSPIPYRGYAMQAMVSQSSNHAALSLDLQDLQSQLLATLPSPGCLYPLPAASFHQTIANTFSAERYQRHLADTGIEAAFPQSIAEQASRWPEPDNEEPPVMRLIGLSLFRTAIGILGVFENQRHFQRVIDFRDRFYGDERLAQIGLVRTRPFIGHLTLAYLERPLDPMETAIIVDGIDRINMRLRDRLLQVEMPFAQLHSYENLSHFHTQSDFPQVKL